MIAEGRAKASTPVEIAPRPTRIPGQVEKGRHSALCQRLELFLQTNCLITGWKGSSLIHLTNLGTRQHVA